MQVRGCVHVCMDACKCVCACMHACVCCVCVCVVCYIPMVSSYKYLGCVVDEHLEFREMVEEKAAAGRRALGAWLNKCRVEVGIVEIRTFKKLMSAWVDSTMLYGAEIWGCTSSAETIRCNYVLCECSVGLAPYT